MSDAVAAAAIAVELGYTLLVHNLTPPGGAIHKKFFRVLQSEIEVWEQVSPSTRIRTHWIPLHDTAALRATASVRVKRWGSSFVLEQFSAETVEEA